MENEQLNSSSLTNQLIQDKLIIKKPQVDKKKKLGNFLKKKQQTKKFIQKKTNIDNVQIEITAIDPNDAQNVDIEDNHQDINIEDQIA